MDWKGNDQVIDLKGDVVYDDDLRIYGNNNTLKNVHLVRSAIHVVGFGNRITRISFHEAPLEPGAWAWLYGGDKYALKRSGNVIDSCEFWDHSISQGTIELVGCGATARNNRLHNQANPYPAIKMIGAWHLVTGNQIEYVYEPNESDDAGAISVGRRLDWPGSIVRNNRIRMVSKLTDEHLDTLYLNALYCDDMQSLTRWEGNEINGFPIGLKLGGGSFNTIMRNTFTKCGRGIQMDARGLDWMVGEKASETTKSLHDIPRDSALWRKYGARLGMWSPTPTGNVIQDNSYIDCRRNQSLDKSELYGANAIETAVASIGGE